ncbi:MAG: hypothetical protein AAF676_01525 [Pseudomonadota bacterium]
MKKTLSVFALTLGFLALMDLAVAGVLRLAEAQGRLGGLVQYFEYGRSVPGKLARWRARPGTRGNLFDVAWRSEIVAASTERFAKEPESIGQVIRTYGMSFTSNILRPAAALSPQLTLDQHVGPSASPNFTYALFLDDRANRRPGDVAVLGVLSSGVPALAALSNRTWIFEQPAPFTYPVFRLQGDGLERIEPLIDSAAAERALTEDPDPAWTRQLAQKDAFHGWANFGAPWLDVSPFARLVRRSLATAHVAEVEAEILAGESFPYEEVLRRILVAFAETAHADGQTPLVMLIQTRDPVDADLLALARPVLERHDIPYFATAEHVDPRDPSGFLGDGHYRPEIDRMFAERLREILAP